MCALAMCAVHHVVRVSGELVHWDAVRVAWLRSVCLAVLLLVLLVSAVPALIAGVCVCVCVQTTLPICAVCASAALLVSAAPAFLAVVCVRVCRLLARSVTDKFRKLILMSCALVTARVYMCVCVCECFVFARK